MSLPRLKLRAPVTFPGQISALAPIHAVKQAGTWNFSLDYTGFGLIPGGVDPSLVYTLAWDPVQLVFYATPLTAIVTAGSGVVRTITAAGTVAVGIADGVIGFRQTVPAAVSVTLPSAASRNLLPLSIEDVAGVAAANPITITPFGAEHIDGLTSFQVANDYGFVRLRPYAGLGWKVISP